MATRIRSGGAPTHTDDKPRRGAWFYNKSPEAQRAYIAAHPNSVYAKKAAALKARDPKRRTPEQLEDIREKRQAALKKNRATHDPFDPKIHEKDMKAREKHRALYQKKVDSQAKKIEAAKERVAKHKASGSPRLKAAQRDLTKATINHGSLKKIVTGIDRMAKARQKAYDKHHGKAPKKRAVKRPSVEP